MNRRDFLKIGAATGLAVASGLELGSVLAKDSYPAFVPVHSYGNYIVYEEGADNKEMLDVMISNMEEVIPPEYRDKVKIVYSKLPYDYPDDDIRSVGWKYTPEKKNG